MNPSVIAWMSAVQGLLAVAPDVILFAVKVKGWVKDMFASGLITYEAQNALMKRVDEICKSVLTGQVPDHWKVEADPE